MVEMADNPKLDLASFRRNTDGIEENTVSRKIIVLDHLNGFQYTTKKKPDNFVIDMESFSNIDDNINSNSRITRSISKKGSSRGGGGGGGGSDTVVPVASSPPRGSAMLEMVASPPLAVAGNPQSNHPITVSITASASNTSTDGRFAARRNSFKQRLPFSLAIDPKRVLFFFATISSMGTILLIYFTLAVGKYQD